MHSLTTKILVGKRLFMYCCFFMCYIGLAQQTNTNIVAKLKIEQTDNAIKLVAVASNTTEVYYSLRYAVSIIRPDPNAPDKTIKDSKEERFTIAPIESKEVAETTFTIDEEERVIALFLIYDEDEKLVGRYRHVFNDENEKEEEDKVLPNDGIEFFGIIADESKTKLGKDFYDYFYFYHTFYKIEGQKIISVKEIVSFRRNTRIQVVIEDNVVFEFYSQPSDEFIESMAKEGIQRVYRYFENLKKENAYITKY